MIDEKLDLKFFVQCDGVLAIAQSHVRLRICAALPEILPLPEADRARNRQAARH
jgi:hypothetical protein